MKIGDLVSGASGLQRLIPIGIGIIIGIVLLYLLPGVFVQQVSDGTIDVPDSTNTSVTGMLTSVTEIGGNATSALTFVFAFIVVVILMTVFASYIGGKKGDKGLN